MHIPRSANVRTLSVPFEPRPSPRTDPGSNVPRSSRSEPHSQCRARPHRASREATPRGRAAQLIYRGRAAQLIYRGRSRCPTRKASSHVRPETFGQSIHPADHDGRTPKISATIVPTVPIADHDPIAGRSSRLTVRTVRSTQSRF
ncbi:unnamed protein product [Microthlaspi erraticum]|uniref:Uncharacterized protein n=1 Tax=Microthlaspi erraticum TaxID=1685480 RepID=A0A6D2J375_9BRAS|nr:unnamed protein product [Microthlaspi erraticum]